MVRVQEPKNEFLGIAPKIIQELNCSSITNYGQSLKKEWNNILFQGDNLPFMRSLLKQFKGKIKLIYIDPPFASGENYYHKIFIGDEGFTENALAYTDIWHEGKKAYLSFLRERLELMKHLLTDDGSIYVHLDWHVSHYVKLLMDEIFGEGNFRNEIIWAYPAASARTRRFFIRSYDAILFYTKSDEYVFNDDPAIYMEYSHRVKFALQQDEKGWFYYRGGSHDGKKLSRKVYVKNKGIFPRDVWTDIPYIRANTTEYQGFSTQKPERLLKRIILASSNEGDLVADFFCGSGTSLVVAEKLNRRWIGSDLARNNIHITRKRLLNVAESNDLIVWKQTYGKNYNPFNLMTPKDDVITLPKDLLSKALKGKDNIKIPDPELDLEIIKKDEGIFIELKDFKHHYTRYLKQKVLKHLNDWTDYIDYWSITELRDDSFFLNKWVSFKAPKIRDIKLVGGPLSVDDSNESKLLVEFVDIFGNKMLKEI